MYLLAFDKTGKMAGNINDEPLFCSALQNHLLYYTPFGNLTGIRVR
jgi:hypothetical protein